MPPLLSSFLADLLIESDCKQSTLVLDKAVTPDFDLRQRVRQSERRILLSSERSIHRHHSHPLLRTKPSWPSESTCPSSPPSNPPISRWDSGSPTSSGFDGNNSDPQVIFPLRTCDDQRYNNPMNRADRWSVSRYHSDSLVSPLRSKEKLSLDRPLKKSKPKAPFKAVPKKQNKVLPGEIHPEMEMTWRRSKLSIRRRPSLKQTNTKNRPQSTLHEMEIIWERETSSAAKQKEEKQSIVRKIESSGHETLVRSRSCPSLRLCPGNTSALEDLLVAIMLLICDPSSSTENSCTSTTTSTHIIPSKSTTTIFNFCGGDVAPACHQLEYDLLDSCIAPTFLRRQISLEKDTTMMDSIKTKTAELPSLRRLSSCVTL